MDEYISRQAVLNKINERQRKLIYCFGFENDAVKIMDIAKSIVTAIPAADVVPVVRCGQCGYWHGNDGDYGYCYAKDGQGFGHTWGKNDFCSYGERKE